MADPGAGAEGRAGGEAGSGIGGGPGDVLSRAHPTGRRSWVLATSETRLEGGEMEGLREARDGSGRLFLGALETDAGTATNLHADPTCLRRERVGPGGVILETIRAADRSPGLMASWSAPGGGLPALTVGLVLPGPVTGHRREGSEVVVEVGPESRRILVVVEPEPRSVAVEDAPDGPRLVLRTDPAAGDGAPGGETGGLTVRVAPVPPGKPPGAALRSLRHPAALETRARAHARALTGERLATATGVAEMDEGLAWAAASLLASPPAVAARGDAGSSAGAVAGLPASLWALTTALAAGDRSTARRLLDLLPAGPGEALGVGEWVRWTGEARTLGERLPRLRDELLAGSGAPGRGAELLPVARSAVADALEALGATDGARELREAPLPTRGRPLPMLGGSGSGAVAPGGPTLATLAGLLLDSGGPAPGADLPGAGLPGAGDPGAPGTALRAWGLYRLGRPDDAFPLLRQVLATAVPPWPGAGPVPPLPPGVLAPAVLLRGLLGAQAEAPWGRLRMAPALPSHWTSFRVRGVAVADARVEMEYGRDYAGEKTRDTFTLRQTAGRVPVNLVFEPTVPGRVAGVWVDDEPAEVDLAPDPGRGRTRLRLQLPLDDVRRIRIARVPDRPPRRSD